MMQTPMLRQYPSCARLLLLWVSARLDQLTESYLDAAEESGEIDAFAMRELDAEYLANMSTILSAGAKLVQAAAIAQRYFDVVPPEFYCEMVRTVEAQP